MVLTRCKLGLLLLLLSSISFGQNGSTELQASYKVFDSLRTSSPYQLEWLSVGPYVNSARAEAVQAHPSQPGVLYAAFGSGGLWKSIDNGLFWTPVFENKPSLGIGDFAIAPSDPDIIYLGTGESLRKARNFTMPGDGVYKSIDGGVNWQHLGLDESWHIGEIVIHPTNPDVVFVAVLGKFWSESTNRGIYKTEDGGVSWEQVLFVNENTGANDIVISPSNPNILYATTWEFKATVRGDKNYNNVGKGSGVYLSKDGGESWTKSTNGLPEGPKIGRSGITVSYQNSQKAYVFLDNQNNASGETGEVYKTIDGGMSWVRANLGPLKLLSVVNWYFMDVYVSPDNDDEVYALGVRVAHSTDGGKTFTYLAGDVKHITPSAAQGLHLDHCELWINPTNSNHLILANDGGVYSSYNRGESWLHHNNIPTGEFYDITLTNENPYTIYGGVQDDATVYGPAKELTNNVNDSWSYLWIDPWNGGDGCITQVDPENPNIIYFSAQEGAVRRLDSETNKVKGIRPMLSDEEDESLRFNFITPYIISHYDHKTLYQAGNYIFKSTDRGANWQTISGNLAEKEKGNRNSVAAGAFAESSLATGLLYVGTDKGAFWTSSDDGAKWREYSKGLPIGYIRSIEASKHKLGRVYLTLTGINYDDFKAYLFVSEDNGRNWTLIANNLPNEPLNKVVEDYENEDILYVGGYRGVYVSVDRGKEWHVLGTKLPAASISDIEIHQKSKDIVVSTHGRGIYFANLHPFTKALKGDPSKLRLFEIPDAIGPSQDTPGSKRNPATIKPALISFWLPEATEFMLELKNEEKSLLILERPGSKGLNQYSWNLLTESIKSEQPYFIYYDKYLTEGDYTITLTVEGKVLSQGLVVH